MLHSGTPTFSIEELQSRLTARTSEKTKMAADERR